MPDFEKVYLTNGWIYLSVVGKTYIYSFPNFGLIILIIWFFRSVQSDDAVKKFKWI
jgi:hypothetical protein